MSTERRIPSIDVAKGVAILFVIGIHAEPEHSPFGIDLGLASGSRLCIPSSGDGSAPAQFEREIPRVLHD